MDELTKPDGPVQNLGLVMGTMCGLADRWEVISDTREVMWTKHIIKMATECGVEMMEVSHKIIPYTVKNYQKDNAGVKPTDWPEHHNFVASVGYPRPISTDRWQKRERTAGGGQSDHCWNEAAYKPSPRPSVSTSGSELLTLHRGIDVRVQEKMAAKVEGVLYGSVRSGCAGGDQEEGR